MISPLPGLVKAVLAIGVGDIGAPPSGGGGDIGVTPSGGGDTAVTVVPSGRCPLVWIVVPRPPKSLAEMGTLVAWPVKPVEMTVECSGGGGGGEDDWRNSRIGR